MAPASTNPVGEWDPGRGPLSPGLYVHIPFCTVRCSYCDFHVAGFRAAIVVRYVDTLLEEARRLAGEGFRPRTIFIGGGTPSSLAAAEWARLLEGLAALFAADGLLEWTVEANPGTVDREKALIARAAGVDRISTGAQTFDPAGLRVLGREHGAETVAAAHETLRDAGFARLSLDLILGWPGQTIESVENDIRQVEAIDPGHLSLYHLSYEKGTLLERRRRAGLVEPLPDSRAIRLARCALGGLSRAGYTRYEVSNLCRPGQASLHNLNYWQGGSYRGIGSGAASYDGARRWRNRPDVGAYLRAEGLPERVDEEVIDAGTALEELLLLSLRLTEGLELERFRAAAGAPAEEALAGAIEELAEAGLLVREDGRLRATERGFEVLDAVIVRLWEDHQRFARRTPCPSRATPPT
jgi:oxygen-independent coproporphyrinogen-3 oxidase